MKWMKERDLLIAQTLAFVQSVTGKLPETDRTTAVAAASHPTASPPAPVPPAVLPPIEAAASTDAAPPPPPVDLASPLIAIQSLLAEKVPVVPPPAELLAHVEPETFPEVELAAPVVAQVPAWSASLVRPDLREDFQSEIRARVASFRAQQERFTREREAYCSTTMAKVHASIREIGQPTPSGE